VSLPATQRKHPACLFLGLTTAQQAAFHCPGWLERSDICFSCGGNIVANVQGVAALTKSA